MDTRGEGSPLEDLQEVAGVKVVWDSPLKLLPPPSEMDPDYSFDAISSCLEICCFSLF